ncbi:MAG: DUF3048 domain-containing protein [Actinomycetota bacterium]
MRKFSAFLMAFLLVLLPACGGKEKKSAKPKKSAASPSPAKPALCPLTGAAAPSDLDSDRPALSVKIDNSVKGRPQAGLEKADIVYEELAEGGITRFNAIYHCSDAESLGPVRSARFVDVDINLEYGGRTNNSSVLFAYAGAAGPVQDKVASTSGITDLRHGKGAAAYRREKGRSAPQNLFSSTEALRGLKEAQDVKGAPETGLEFETSGPASPSAAGAPSVSATSGASSSPSASGAPPAAGAASPGNEVSFTFAGGQPSRYTYDAASGAYLRFHGAQAHNSAASGQLKVVNVVIFKVQVKPGTIKDAAGNVSPDISVIGNGEAVVLSGGQSKTGKWNRVGLADKTTITDAAGAPIKLKPGNTWIHLIPTSQAITVK